MESLKETRKELGLTQTQAAALLNVSRRTYQTYEKGIPPINQHAKNEMERLLEQLEQYLTVDKEHGLISRKKIVDEARKLFANYPQIKCAYLFGSYARNEPKPTSDVDILVVVEGVMGLSFYGMMDELEERLNKNVDIITHRQACESANLLSRILKEGIKIYG